MAFLSFAKIIDRISRVLRKNPVIIGTARTMEIPCILRHCHSQERRRENQKE